MPGVTGSKFTADMIFSLPTFKELAVRSLFSRVFLPLSLASGIVAMSGCSGMADKTRSVSNTTTAVGHKVDSAVRHGLQTGSEAVGNAAKAAEGPVDRAAKKIGLPRGPTPTPEPGTGGN